MIIFCSQINKNHPDCGTTCIFTSLVSLHLALGSALRNLKSWQRLIWIRSLPGSNPHPIRRYLLLQHRRISRALRTEASLLTRLLLWETWSQRWSTWSRRLLRGNWSSPQSPWGPGARSTLRSAGWVRWPSLQPHQWSLRWWRGRPKSPLSARCLRRSIKEKLKKRERSSPGRLWRGVRHQRPLWSWKKSRCRRRSPPRRTRKWLPSPVSPPSRRKGSPSWRQKVK